ncbi:MAG TPA: Holliday junction branch migration DNA helicase RuvB [Persephonella sp.]|uniref:Holliday junction branch migration complex subunit RuvB n=1 Tax=Persephonella marina (strain DSM 14350 / EX-H1) TaxID=123214 RepID=C0QS78_PERMH|nr:MULTISPECIES: Holliday junction branch migration DNA helicase RuvB [Persephonella]ACO04608.1 holliday junction DNA helicase RuvB [Persephonella marina EX-H1]HCB69267.1 Holliday junction branch migration DNA helicase RuvB [Persephonella sp.]
MEILREESFDIDLRPKSIDDYIGQDEVKKQIKIFVDASKKTGKTLDHILIGGPPGLGKTSLAQVIARELGKNIVFTSGPVLEKKGDIAGILSSLEEGDILFIDEIHRLNPSVEEALYPAMEDFCLDIIIGKGSSSRSVRIDIPPFTLIGATTRSGMLTSPLISRFGIILHIDYYDTDSLTRIVLRSAKILGIKITENGAREIARRSRGTPRIANRFLKRVYDFAVVKKDGTVTEDTAREALDFLGIDSYGLDSRDRKYLQIIIEKFNGKPVGLNTLSSALSEDRYTIEEIIEPFLLRSGFIERTPKGRKPTDKALKIFKKI